jgi:site-specific DNA recombinase
VGKHEGIISGADWIRAQSIMATISKDQAARANKESSNALLSGVVRCVKCGGKMYVRAESGRTNPDDTMRYSYYCGSLRNKDWKCDKPPTVRGYELDNFVIEQICKIDTGDALYEELLYTQNTLATKSVETEKEHTELRKRLNQIESDISTQITNLRSAPEAVKQAIYTDIEALSKERDEKQARLDEIQSIEESQEIQLADIEKAKQTILDFPRLIRLVDYEGKLQLLRRVLECVIVKGDTAHIFLKGSEVPVNFTKTSERSDVRHTEPGSIFYTSRAIGGQLYFSCAVEVCDALYQAYCAYGY